MLNKNCELGCMGVRVHKGVWGPEARPHCFPVLPFSRPGFDMTPNYVDSSPTGIVISPWCSCRGSGNAEEECERFLSDFTENPCLRELGMLCGSPWVHPSIYLLLFAFPATGGGGGGGVCSSWRLTPEQSSSSWWP